MKAYHPFVGRLYLLLVLLGIAISVAIVHASKAPAKDSACRSSSTSSALSMMDIELARQPVAILRALHTGSAEFTATPEQRQCVEARVEEYQYLFNKLDGGLFIPLYLALSVCLVTWFWLLEENALRLLSLAILTIIFLLAGADYQENKAAVNLLLHAQAHYPNSPSPFAVPQDLIDRARTASVSKWGLSAIWLVLIAILNGKCLSKKTACLQYLTAGAGVIGATLLAIGSINVAMFSGADWAIGLILDGFILALVTLFFDAIVVLMYTNK